MLKNQKGFAHWLIPVVIVILAVIGFAGWRVANKSNTKANTSTASQSSSSSSNSTSSSGLLELKSIGFNLDYYDAATNHAGDMVFTHGDHDLSNVNHMIIGDFGIQDYRAPNDPSKRNPQPTFILPLGTKVHSLVDGTVIKVEGLYSGDSTIMVSATGDQNSSYIYETEHIINPLVKAGDHVKGDQVIGEVSTHDSQYHPGFGIVEIGILHPSATQAQHICPFHYLQASIKDDIEKKILNVHKAWMDYIGMPSLYDDAHAAEPGCFSLDPVNG